MNSVCFSAISVQPFTVLVDCYFNTEELPNQIAISSSEFQRQIIVSQKTDWIRAISDYFITLSPVLSAHLFISVSHAQLDSPT